MEIGGFYGILPMKEFRRTPGVEFHIITRDNIPGKTARTGFADYSSSDRFLICCGLSWKLCGRRNYGAWIRK